MAVWLLDMDKEYLVEVHGMDKGSFLETLSGDVLVKIFLETLWLGNGVTFGFGLAGINISIKSLIWYSNKPSSLNANENSKKF